MKRLVSGAVVASVTLVAAAPAFADNMNGTGSSTSEAKNDWSEYANDEHVLPSQFSTGNVVGVWQHVLHADGFLPLCGSTGIDGRFGPATTNATVNYQNYYHITADGIVGDQTWGKADNFLRRITTGLYVYDGFYDSPNFLRSEPAGDYFWTGGNADGIYDTAHPTPNFSKC